MNLLGRALLLDASVAFGLFLLGRIRPEAKQALEQQVQEQVQNVVDELAQNQSSQ